MCKTVFEFSWRIVQQLIIFDQDETDMSKIKGWGADSSLNIETACSL